MDEKVENKANKIHRALLANKISSATAVKRLVALGLSESDALYQVRATQDLGIRAVLK